MRFPLTSSPDDKSLFGDGFLKPANILLIHNHHHPDAHVEDPIHLLRGNLAAFLDQAEKRWDCPGLCVDDCIHVFRQDTRDVFDEAAAGQVGQCFDRRG